MKILFSPYAVGFWSRVVVQVAAFVQVMLAARYLDLANFGAYALAWAATVITVSFVYTGFYQALLRSEDFQADRDTGFAAMVVIGLGGSAALALASAWQGGTVTGTSLMFMALAPLPLVRALIAWNEVHLVRRKAVRTVSINTAVAECLALIAVAYSLANGMELMSLVVGRYVALVSEFVVIVGAVRAVPGIKTSLASMRRLRATALPLWGTSALGMFSIYGADLILGAFLNPAAVGTYRAGARISQTATDLVLQPLNMLSWSRFTRLGREGRSAEIGAAWLESMGLAAAVLWPVLTSVALLASELITVLFQESWVPAAAVAVVLSVSRAVRFLSALLEPTLVCLDRGAVQLRIRFVGAAVLLAGLLTFGRQSVEAATYAHLLASVVVAIYAMHALKSALQLRIDQLLRCFVPGLAVAAGSAAIILGSGEMRSGMTEVAGLVAAFALLAVFWLVAVGICLRRGYLSLPRA